MGETFRTGNSPCRCRKQRNVYQLASCFSLPGFATTQYVVLKMRSTEWHGIVKLVSELLIFTKKVHAWRVNDCDLNCIAFTS